LQNTAVYLIGFAGTGKYTIAKELAKLDDFKLVHNHLVNDVIFDVVQEFEKDAPEEIWEQIAKVRNIMLETIEKHADKELNYIFTNELTNKRSSDRELFRKIENIFNLRNSDFYPVKLIIDKEEHKKRLESKERKLSHKISDGKYADSLSNVELLEVKNKNLIEINVSNLSAENAAKEIMKEIKERKCQ